MISIRCYFSSFIIWKLPAELPGRVVNPSRLSACLLDETFFWQVWQESTRPQSFHSWSFSQPKEGSFILIRFKYIFFFFDPNQPQCRAVNFLNFFFFFGLLLVVFFLANSFSEQLPSEHEQGAEAQERNWSLWDVLWRAVLLRALSPCCAERGPQSYSLSTVWSFSERLHSGSTLDLPKWNLHFTKNLKGFPSICAIIYWWVFFKHSHH